MNKQALKKVILIMLLITVSEGVWVIFTWMENGYKFWKYLGFTVTSPVLGWFAAFLTVVIFVVQGMRLPSVKEHLLRISGLKILALFLAFFAAILEEVFFRKELMNYVAHHHGWLLQVFLSGIIFGLIHAVWGLFARNARAVIGAFIATGILGFALALVYIASNRVLAPCIAAHFFIDVLMEPGLVIAAVKGEMGRMKKTKPGSQFNLLT